MSGLKEHINTVNKWGLLALAVLVTLLVWEDSRITEFYNRMDRRIVDTTITEERCDMLSDAVRFLPK